MADDAATTPEGAGAAGAAGETEQQGEGPAEGGEEHTSFMAQDFNDSGEAEDEAQPGNDEEEEGGNDSEEGDENQEEDSEDDGPPEQYADFELPEGMPMNEAALERAKPMFKELGLNQENAQKAVTMHAELLQDMEQQQQTAVLNMRKEWAKELNSDPNAKELNANSRKAVEFFGDDTLKQMFYKDWLGDNPSFVRCMAKIGEAMGDDNFVGGDGFPTSTKDIQDRMFGDMPGLK